jgi:hypothetical protein
MKWLWKLKFQQCVVQCQGILNACICQQTSTFANRRGAVFVPLWNPRHKAKTRRSGRAGGGVCLVAQN